MLGMEYREGADWQAFFGDVGPTEGCSALQEIKNRIMARDLAEFRAAYVDAVSKGMAPTAFSDVPDTRLSIEFNSPFAGDPKIGRPLRGRLGDRYWVESGLAACKTVSSGRWLL